MQEEFESFLFFAIVCALISIHNILNVETSYILEILFYVNIILTILFYLKGIYYSKCCRCNRKVPVRRQNIGRIMSGQMPLCQTCKLIYGFDFVYSMTNTGGNLCTKGKEIVITNYEIE